MFTPDTNHAQRRLFPLQASISIMGMIVGSCVSTAFSNPEDTPDSLPGEVAEETDLSLDDLGTPDDELGALELDETIDLLFEDFDIVVSASRSAQSANLAPVPVSILSSDDIHYSGVGELPELFAFVPGFDSLRIDKNRWSLGVRGLNQVFSDRTLFLVNGRNASNPLYGGVDYPTLPIFLEDIEQVEVVRGPGGAAWGANAYNGVVNVIEKDLRDTTGLLLSTRINEHGDMRSNLRFGAANEKFAWRLSAEFEELDPSRAPNRLTSATATGPALNEDFRRNAKMKFSGEYSIDEEHSIDMSIGTTRIERSDSPFTAQQYDFDERMDLITGHVKYKNDDSDGTGGYIQWYGTYHDVDRPSLWAYTAFDQSFDGQYSFERGQDHTTTIGGTARFVSIDVEPSRSTDAMTPGTRDEQWLGMFIGDQWVINDRWTLESQVRADWYSETSVDWAGRAALLRSMGDEKEHVFRFALAKSFRTPQSGLRELGTERFPLGGGLFGINLVPANDIDNEELYSIEIGYTGKLRDGLTLRADAYLQYYQDLTGVIILPEPAPTLGRLFFTVDNIGSAKAWGAETELKYQRDKFTGSVWYTYNDFSFDLAGQNARAFRPARHKIGSTLRYQPSDWLTLNANYRYTSDTPGTFTVDVDEHHRFDLSASIMLRDLNAEIQFGVTDLFDETDLIVFDQSSTSFATESVGRSAFVQLNMSF
jgi:outer membrane receptor protein involved in Fe transport